MYHVKSMYHVSYGSTSCCISRWSSQWEMAIFNLHSSDTHPQIFVKLEIFKYGSIRHNCQFEGDTCWDASEGR